MKKFLTIRQAAATEDCPVGEAFIRRLVHEDRCPGFYSGTRFLVNLDALIEQMEAQSREMGRDCK